MRTTGFSIVHRSNFASHDVKYGALISEYKKAHEMDKRILGAILTDPSVKSPYCHVACALKGEKNNIANEFDETIYDEKGLKLSPAKKKVITSYMNSVRETFFYQLLVHTG